MTTLASVPNTLNVEMVSLALIDMPAWNSRMPKAGAALRREEEKIVELAESMNAEGQLTPVELEPKTDGRYGMVFGTRRFRAAQHLKWSQIAATVKVPSTEAERAVRNMIENEQRENLTTFEQARGYARMRDLGLKNAEIGAKCGKSQSHISNLSGAYKRLPEPILKEWAAQHPVATFDNLQALANTDKLKTPTAQVEAWDALVREQAAAVASGQKAGKRGKAKGKGGTAGYTLVKANVDLAIDLLSPRKRAEEAIGGNKKWANEFLQWLIGQRKNPPDGIVAPVKETK